MIFLCFAILLVSLILVLYANSLDEKNQQKKLKYFAYGIAIFDILIAFFI